MDIHKRRMWVAAFTLAGSVIGAGILGLPYVFSKSGFIIGLFWIIVLGIFISYAKLCFGEITLRTKAKHQLQGYAKKYLGIWGARVAFFSMFFGIYSALLAYLIGEGQSFSQLFTGGLDYAIYFGIGFWIVMTLLLREGLKGLKRIEAWGVFVILLIVVGLFVAFLPEINFENLSYIKPENFFIPFGVTLFALLGFTAIPEMRLEIAKSERFLKRAIILGSVIPIVVYILFSFSFVGVFGSGVSEVATLSSGRIVALLGIFTMLTSYFVLSFAMKDMFLFDLHKKKGKRFFYVSFVPLLLYLLISFFNLASFVLVLGIAGVVSGGLTGILVLIMNLKSKKLGDRKSEYKIPINWFVIALTGLLFAVGIVLELLPVF